MQLTVSEFSLVVLVGISGSGKSCFAGRHFKNFEITAVLADPQFVSEVERMFEDDFARSRLVEEGEYTDKSPWFRFTVRVARLTSPLL